MAFSAGSLPAESAVRPGAAGTSEPSPGISTEDPAAEGGRESPGWIRALLVALPGWAIGHLLVIAVSAHINPRHPLAQLFKWDTEWYRYIAAHGYPAGGGLIHFFPLTSACAALLVWVTRMPVSIALFGFCWLAALFFGAALYRLTFFETGDRGAARRAAWLIQLAPGGYALVMGYTEPAAGLLAVGYFFALRLASAQGHGVRRDTWRRWGLVVAMVTGCLSGVARPTGVVLAVAGLAEGWRISRQSGWRKTTVIQAALAAVAPAAGLFGYLAFSYAEYGSWTLPFSQQVLHSNRGAIVNDPLTSLHFWLSGPQAHTYGPQIAVMAVILIGIAVALTVFTVRRLAFSYFAWVVPMLILASTSQIFTSLPRYVGAIFPLVMVLAICARRRWQEVAVYVVSAGLLVWASHIVLTMRLTG